MSEFQKPIRIGNSKGVRIPARLIRCYQLERGFIMKVLQEGILIAPAPGSNLSLDESFAAMASDRAEQHAAREWAEAGLADGLEEEPNVRGEAAAHPRSPNCFSRAAIADVSRRPPWPAAALMRGMPGGGPAPLTHARGRLQPVVLLDAFNS